MILFCFVLMASLTVENWVRFFVWLTIGLLFYFDFGVRHSTAGRSADARAQRALMLVSDKALMALSSVLLLLAIVGGTVVWQGLLQAGILEEIGLFVVMILAIVFLWKGYSHYREDSLAPENS